MIRVSTSDLRKDTADVLNKVAYGGDRVALQRRGKDVAVIVSVEDYELLKVIEDKADLEMIRKIKRNWEIPKLAHYGLKGRLVIRFYLMKDGRVEGLRILVSSGIPPYDNASLQAVRNSSPFRPIPPDFPNPREGVTITFLYNIRPEDLDSFDQQPAAPRPLLPR